MNVSRRNFLRGAAAIWASSALPTETVAKAFGQHSGWVHVCTIKVRYKKIEDGKYEHEEIDRVYHYKDEHEQNNQLSEVGTVT